VRFLIDECLHTSLVDVAQRHGHEAHHVNWLGLSGATDRGLMPRIVEQDFTFVTNNAGDFRRLYARQEVRSMPASSSSSRRSRQLASARCSAACSIRSIRTMRF
jgi:hypothetical protein